MGVVQAQFQTVEEKYGLVWTAVARKRPIKAIYQGCHRLFCPHRLRRNREGSFVFSVTRLAARAKAGLAAWVHPRMAGSRLRIICARPPA